MSTIILKRGRESRLIAGHCWVYAGEIHRITGQPADGDAVEIYDEHKRCHGVGLLNRRSQIAVRRLTTKKQPLDDAFFRRRIAAALAYRQQLGLGDVCRVVSSEGDRLPGLIVDRYGDHLVLQALTLGMDHRKAALVEILRDLVAPAAIIERSDVSTRQLEGLPEAKGVLWGRTDGRVRILIGRAASGVTFAVNLLEDQKTGFFLDQAANYATVAGLSAGRRVLDCFSYHGGFALAAAQAQAAGVEAIESSEAAIVRARQNAELNNLTDKIEFIGANAFDELKKYDARKRQFDLIVLDPPTFTRSKDRIDDALRGYKEINLRALKMLPPGGLLATFTCSHHITSDLFLAAVLEAAADARQTIRLRQWLTQAPDHPVLPAVPQTEYLKGLLLEVL